MSKVKEQRPNQLTWDERHPKTYSVKKIIISEYLNHKSMSTSKGKNGKSQQSK